MPEHCFPFSRARELAPVRIRFRNHHLFEPNSKSPRFQFTSDHISINPAGKSADSLPTVRILKPNAYPSPFTAHLPLTILYDRSPKRKSPPSATLTTPNGPPNPRHVEPKRKLPAKKGKSRRGKKKRARAESSRGGAAYREIYRIVAYSSARAYRAKSGRARTQCAYALTIVWEIEILIPRPPRVFKKTRARARTEAPGVVGETEVYIMLRESKWKTARRKRL